MHPRIIIPIAAALVCTGCGVTVGQKMDAATMEQFQIGTATMAQVSEKLGTPKTIVKSSEDNSTDYQYVFITAGVASAKGEVYHFVFGPDGILLKRFVTEIDQRRG